MKVTTVQAARKAPGNCGRCGDAIPVGAPYRWTQSYRGPRPVRCMKLECAFRPSETTSNDKLARLYEIQEEMAEMTTRLDVTPDEVIEAVEDWAGRADEVADEFEESGQAIEEGFGHPTEQSEQATENADAAREWADTIRNVEFPDPPDPEAAEDEEDADSDREAWAEEALNAIDGLIGELSL